MNAGLLILMLAGLLHSVCSAQDALEPCSRERANPYYDGVNQVISAAVGQQSSLLLTTLPSFEPESGVRLVGAKVYLVEFRSSFWAESNHVNRQGIGRMDFTKPAIKTRTRHAPIDAALARRIELVYSKAIANAKKLEQVGVDGVSYLMSTSNGACASAWSPRPRTPNDRLIMLLRRLERHATLSAAIDLRRSEREIAHLLYAIDGY